MKNPPSKKAKSAVSSKKILIVEDEQILRDAYVHILSQEGYRVSEARNGREALESLEREDHDLILLDILMPKMDGLEFLKKAKLTKKHPRTKVIAFSNLSDHKKLEFMVGLGVTKNILKSSLSPKQLAEAVKHLLS